MFIVYTVVMMVVLVESASIHPLISAGLQNLSECNSRLRDCSVLENHATIEVEKLEARVSGLMQEIRLLQNDRRELQTMMTALTGESKVLRPMEVVGIILSIFISIQGLWFVGPYIFCVVMFCWGSLVKVFSLVMKLPGKMVSRCRATAGFYQLRFENEAYVSTSPISRIDDGSYPNHLFRMYSIDGEQENMISFVGHGFHVQAGGEASAKVKFGTFVTTAHNLRDGKMLLVNANKPTMMEKIPSDAWTILDNYDVAYYMPTQQQATRLGTKIADRPSSILRSSIVVSTWGNRQTSTGLAKTEVGSPVVILDATTERGFSGSSYSSNNLAIAMHLGSNNKTAVGLCMYFIHRKIRAAESEKLGVKVQESSPEYILNQIEKSLNGFEFYDYGMDDVVMFDPNKEENYMLSRNDFEEVRRRASKKLRKHRPYVKQSYSDVETVPKNCQPPQVPVLDLGEQAVPSVPTQSQVEVQKHSKLNGLLPLSTDGPLLTPVPSNVAFQSTLESLMKVVEKLEYRLRVIEQKPLEACSPKPEKSGNRKKSMKT